MNSLNDQNTLGPLGALLVDGGIAVIPTDTLYGVVASAFSTAAVRELYHIKGRNLTKPYIILIGSVGDLDRFGIHPSPVEEEVLKRYWPGPYSIILDCPKDELSYLHRGSNSLAFRVPANAAIQNLLQLTGPLVAPSANPEGRPPARNIEEAKAYFGDSIDQYVEGDVTDRPSTIIKLENGEAVVLRK